MPRAPQPDPRSIVGFLKHSYFAFLFVTQFIRSSLMMLFLYSCIFNSPRKA